MPNTDDPAVLKRALDQMKRLVQDEFNRLSTDFYDFKKATYDAGIIPLRAVSNIAVTFDEYSMTATWELPDGDEITPTIVRVRILEISPNTWAEYSYPKTSWSFSGLTPGTQYTFQVQLAATVDATDTFVSTTRNCPSVPVLRTAESDIKAKVFTTDDGVGPPTDNGTNDDQVIFTFPDTDGTPGAVGSSDCWWGYKFQYRTACAWADTAVSEAFAAGDVGDVTIDTGDVPFSTYPDTLFRLAYREICDGVAQDWVYGEPFMAVDFSNADCLGISKSASLTATPYSTATLFALPSVCQEDGSFLQIVDALTDTEFSPEEPGFKCIEYIDGEWTIIADDTSDPLISNTIFTGLLGGTIPAVADFNAETDFSFAVDIKVPDNALVLAGGTGVYNVINIGTKIRGQIIENTTSYSFQVSVPRDGGGTYVLRADGLQYAQWNSITYVHDVSEPNGRVLYVNGIEQDRSANAIANDFDGITGDVRINTINGMEVRRFYGWDSVIPAIAPGIGETINNLAPVGYWPLNETSGSTVNDESGNGYDGTYVGSPTLADRTGPDGGSYVQIDTDKYASIPDEDVFSTVTGPGLSIAMLVYSDSLSHDQQNLIRKAEEWFIFSEQNTGQLSWRQITSTGNTAAQLNFTDKNISVGQWHLVIVTAENQLNTAEMNLYLDSTTPATGTALVGVGNSSNRATAVEFGRNTGFSTNEFIGNMAHVAIWDRVLTGTEIAQLVASAQSNGWI